MRAITFHYDASRIRHVHILNWLRGQVTYLSVRYENARKDGTLDRGPCAKGSFYAVTDEGAVYCGNKAWLMLLWVTYDHRMTAVRLAARGALGRAIEILYRLSAAI